MPVWGVVWVTVVAESRRPSGRYTLRTTEEAPRTVGGCRPCVSPGMVAARWSLHMNPAPQSPQGRGRLRIFFLFC